MEKEQISVTVVPHHVVRKYSDGTVKRERITPENVKEVERKFIVFF